MLRNIGSDKRREQICFTICKWFSSRVNTKQVQSYIKFLLDFLSVVVAICSHLSYEKKNEAMKLYAGIFVVKMFRFWKP